MFPSEIFGLFPPFPHTNEVFVAISFDPSFAPRREGVLLPAIRSAGLAPYVVNVPLFADAIMTNICRRIAAAKLFVADVSVMPGHENCGGAVRNANVMYEVGLAHAVRLPQEVILFRSDDEKLPFDTNQIRVNRYSPDEEPGSAVDLVSAAIHNALTEVDLTRSATVSKTADQIGSDGFVLLAEAAANGGHGAIKPRTTMGEALGLAGRYAAFHQLLRLGCVTARYEKLTPQMLERPDTPSEQGYTVTPLGDAAFVEILERLGVPELAANYPEFFPGLSQGR